MQMRKKLLSMLVLLIAAVMSTLANEVTIATNTKQISYTSGDITINVHEKGLGDEDGAYVSDTRPMTISCSNGNILSVVLRIGYYSSEANTVFANPGTCTVSGSGDKSTYVTVSDINAASVTIASDGVHIDQVVVTYETVNVTGIALSQTETTMLLGGGTLTLTATVAPADATNKTVTWTTSNASVATVDANGKVTAKGKGTATITATATNGTDDTSDDLTASCTVAVIPAITEGTYIRLGVYGGEYVDWFAARSNTNGWVMLCKYVLTNMKFGSNSTYTESNIYKWLDADAGGTFEDDLHLTTTERSMVKTVNLSSTNGDGTDRFIIPHRTNEQPNGSPYTKAYYIYDKSSLCGAYWLREARDGTNPRVIRSSDATVSARYSGPGNNNGVRPMFYLNTDALSGLAVTGSGTEADPYVFEPRYDLALDVTPSKGTTVAVTVTKDGNDILSGNLPPKILASEAEGATVTLTATPNSGYTFEDVTVTCGGAALTLTGEGNTRTFTMPAADVTVKVDLSLPTDESEAYLIRSLADWELFCYKVNGGNTFSGKTVKMTADVSGVTTMAGTNETNSFQGIFDGQGHTLNVNLSDNSEAPAPFRHIKNATISNLVVTGTISSTAYHVTGLAKSTYGTITIENCNVAATISGAQYMGGFIGHSLSAAVTINGCVFSGTLAPTGSNYAGGFIGWGNGVIGNTMAVTNSLFCGTLAGSATSKFHPIGFNYVPANPTRVFTNTYYTIAAQNINEDTETRSFVKGLDANSKGKQARSITAGDDVTALAISGDGTEYSVSGITAYATGIKYNDVYYAGNSEEVGLTLSHADKTGYTFNQYTATGGGTLSAQTEISATLTMIDADQTISADWTKNELALSEAADNATAISEAAESGKTYAVTLTRTLQTGGWNTFCVPFDLDTPTGWTVKELTASTFNSGTGELTLTFADAAGIEAGKPYLVKVSDAVVNPTFEGVTVSDGTTTTETDNADFVPVMNPTSLTGGDKTVLFVTGGNKLTYPTADGNINGMRAYFQLKGDGASLARAFHMSFDDDATGISQIEDGRLKMEDGVYDLQGRRMASSMFNSQSSILKKGVYIVNGKKTIIK